MFAHSWLVCSIMFAHFLYIKTQIRTRGLQVSLEPLVVKVRDLLSQEGTIRHKQRSGRSMKVIRAVEGAVETFLRVGTSIARENPGHSRALLEAVTEVETARRELSSHSALFASCPLQPQLEIFVQALLLLVEVHQDCALIG